MIALTLLLNNFGGNATTYAREGRVGSPAIPTLAHLATPAGISDRYASVAATVTGIVCGHCSDPDAYVPVVRHASVDHVRDCATLNRMWEADYLAELPLIRAGVL